MKTELCASTGCIRSATVCAYFCASHMPDDVRIAALVRTNDRIEKLELADLKDREKGHLSELADYADEVGGLRGRLVDANAVIDQMKDDAIHSADLATLKLQKEVSEVKRLQAVADKSDRDFWKMRVENTRLRERLKDAEAKVDECQ